MSVTKIAMDVEMDVERIEMLPSATAASKHIPKVEIEIVEDEEKGKPRQAWNNKTEYLLAMVGNAVGIGNIWRFPYQCQKHGGGAFIIPYLIVLGLIGYPMLLLEIGMGQRYKSGAVALWSKLSPYTAGIGISSLMICAILTSYYIIVPSWAFVYAASSFTSPLPFASCPLTAESNYTVEVAECAASSPNVYYWYRQTLNVPDAIEIGGGLNWKILVADLVCVILIFIGLQRGVQSTGRCMYFAVVFPYVVLIAFLIRALTLEGCAEGISYLLRTDVAKLGDMSVWQAAITQIFFSIGLGYGVYVAQASYMPQGNNCTFDVIFVATVNSVTSLLATLIVFAVLGFKAMMNEQKCHARNDLLLESIANSTQNVTLESGSKAVGVTEQNLLNVTLEKCSYQKELDNAVGGPGLAFIAFAEAIVMFPGANFWSLLFFLMLASVGLSSIMGTLTGIIASLRDIGCKMRRIPLAACLCTVLFLLSLIFTLNCGSYMVEILDDNVGTLTLFPVVLCEVVATCYVYGIKRFCDDLKHMTGYRPGWYWKITLAVCCPLLLAVAIVGGYVNYGMNPLKYSTWNSSLAEEVKIFYPHWCIPLIVVLAFLILVSIPAAAVLHKTGLVNMSKIFH